MSTTVPFEKFGSIPRLMREMCISEKIDGTNAAVFVPDDPAEVLLAQSRNRWITPADDNAGFARWVADHAEELRVGLGPGRHFGEWWGCGIQRGYGGHPKTFSLFNAGRWTSEDGTSLAPACCSVVPVLYRGPFSTVTVTEVLAALQASGSHAAPGFMDPEGIVVWHEAARQLFKMTLGNDGHKSARAKEAA